MFKLLIFARRIPGISREEFIRIYESSHIDLVNDLVARGLHKPMQTYRRNYLLKDHPVTTQGPNLPEFDVVVESCFDTMEEFEVTTRNIAADPAAALAVQKDFAKFLDLSSICYCAVEVHEGGGAG